MRRRRRSITDQMLEAHRQTLAAHSTGQVRQDAEISALAATVAEQRETIRVLEARIADLEDRTPPPTPEQVAAMIWRRILI